MDKEEILNEIFNSDPLNILNVKPKSSPAYNPDDRLLASFQEINDFFEKNNREPKPGTGNTLEFSLYSRLKAIRGDEAKIRQLKDYDKYNLLPELKPNQISESLEAYKECKEVSSLDDILSDDSFGILEDDSEDLFDFVHTPKDYQRASSDFVARRKPCKNFDKYESAFKGVQKDLSSGRRELIPFKEDNLQEGNYYVHNGVLMLLEKINPLSKDKFGKDDGRTKCIFENGTESNMLYRSIAKALYANGKAVTQNNEKVNEEFFEKFSNITTEDEEAGFIYVLESLSKDERIFSIDNLYKIGYSRTFVEERIKNADKEPTYLMAPVKIKFVWKCYNLNPQKLEQLLHNFLGNSCLNIDIYDKSGNRHIPKEWFIAPLDIIEQVIQLIINGEVVNYKYDCAIQKVVYKG